MKKGNVYCFKSGDLIFYVYAKNIISNFSDNGRIYVRLDEPVASVQNNEFDSIDRELTSLFPDVVERVRNATFCINIDGCNHIIPTTGRGAEISVYDPVDVDVYCKTAYRIISKLPDEIEFDIDYIVGDYEIRFKKDDTILFFIREPQRYE